MDIPLKPLNEQVIVITGASSGIGLATALAAAQQGAKLVLAARSKQTLDEIVAQLQAQGHEAIAVEADVGDRQQVERIATAALDRFGRIDTWVNDAGVSIYGRLDEVSLEDSRRLFDTNYWGVVHGSLVALPHLRIKGGALINVGSEVSEAVVPLQAMYSASKHAVKGFTDGLRMELEVDKAPVSVTLIQPTAVDTPYPEHAGNYLAQEPKLPTPMIEPEQVAEAILQAAVKPTDAIRVGAMSKINTTIAKLVPPLGEAMAKMQMGRQQRAEAPHAREGTLYRAGESGRVHGRGNENAAKTSEAKASNTREIGRAGGKS
jgi:short-subunit dehydrogenase